MRNLIKLKVIFLVFSVIFGSISKADQLILPKDKPLVDQETKKVTAKKKFILPKKKPLIAGSKKAIKRKLRGWYS